MDRSEKARYFSSNRTLKSRGDHERKALWSRGCVSRTLVFYPAFSLRACMYIRSFSVSFDMCSHSHDLTIMAQDSEARKRVPSVIYTTTTCYIASCGPVCVPINSIFDMNSVSLCALAQQLVHSLDLSLRTQNPRVHSPVVRAADCRSAGPWFSSGRRSWIHTHWHIQRNNIMSPITTTITMPITTITRKSVNMVAELALWIPDTTERQED